MPIVGLNDALVGNISNRDLRKVFTNEELSRLLHEPVRKFVSHISVMEHEEKCPAISCRAKDTILHTLQLVPLGPFSLLQEHFEFSPLHSLIYHLLASMIEFINSFFPLFLQLRSSLHQRSIVCISVTLPTSWSV